jgi:hypothetical protein
MNFRGNFLVAMMFCVFALGGMGRRSPIRFTSRYQDETLVNIAEYLWSLRFKEALAVLNASDGDLSRKIDMHHDERQSACNLLEIALMRFSISPQAEEFCRCICEKMGRDFERECRDFGILLPPCQ